MTGHVHFPIVLRQLEVRRITDVTPSMRRLTLGGEQLGAFQAGEWELTPFRTEGFDDHVKIFFADPATGVLSLPAQAAGRLDWDVTPKPIPRDYTVRAFDAAAGTVDIDVVRHEGGVAAAWVERVAIGDPVHLAGPRGSHVYPAGDWWLLVADETGLPAVGRWIDEAPADAVARIVVSVPSAADIQRFETPAGVELTWLDRSATGDEVTALADAVAAVSRPTGTPVAWVAAEFGRVNAVRRLLLEDWQLDREQIEAASYFRRGVDDDTSAEAHDRLRQLVDLSSAYAVRTLVTLGIPALLAEGVGDVGELARRAGVEARPLRSLLRYLCQHEVIAEASDGTFALGAIGAPLIEEWIDEQLQLGSASTLWERSWAGLAHSLRTGEAAFPQVYGSGFWDHLAANPASQRSFDASLDAWSSVWVSGVATARDWSSVRHVVDIGGGKGRLLAAVLAANPAATGTLLELPSTAAAALEHFEECDVAGRAQVQHGTFFDEWPAGGDCYTLAQVIHDWPDADAVAILRRGAAAVAGGGTIVLVERLVTEPPSPDHVGMDLLMLALFGAAERTADEYAALAEAAGLRLAGIAPAGFGLSFVELRAR